MPNKVKIKLNSIDRVEELMQETYAQACEQLNQIQSEINRITQSTDLDELTIDEKAKYGKILHDFLGDKKQAIAIKMDLTKLMAEVVKQKGDVNKVLEDTNFRKEMKTPNIEQLRKNLMNSSDPEVYTT